MWSRIRLDIGWTDLAFGLLQCLRPSSRVNSKLRFDFSSANSRCDSLASLCLRSSFDTLLSALEFPEGSEILFSAITIPDMPSIARKHGLKPVAVPVLLPDLRVDVAALERLINEKTKAIVVAHLFGNRICLSDLKDAIGSQQILIIEDCAQAWHNSRWSGSPHADVSLFSFGTIKTTTACGGGLTRTTNRLLLESMRSIQEAYPVQNRSTFLKKLGKAALIKLISCRQALGPIIRVSKYFRIDVEQSIVKLTRGFPKGLQLKHLRKRPSAPLLSLMEHRIQRDSSERIRRRIENADLLQAELKECPFLCLSASCEQSHWLYPVITDRAESLIQELRRHGFDATQRGSLTVVKGSQDLSEYQSFITQEAELILKRLVFLPCYPEIHANELRRMCRVVRRWWSTNNQTSNTDKKIDD